MWRQKNNPAGPEGAAGHRTEFQLSSHTVLKPRFVACRETGLPRTAARERPGTRWSAGEGQLFATTCLQKSIKSSSVNLPLHMLAI